MKSPSRPVLAALRRGYSAQAAAQCESRAALPKQQPRVSRLPNGTVVATLENYSPMSRLAMVYNSGARFEDSSNLGITHTIRSLAHLSTQKSTAFGLTRNIQQIGASLTCTTSREHMIYSVDCSRNTVDVGAEFLSHTANPAFKPWEVTDNKARVSVDLAFLQEQPDVQLMEALHQAAYRNGLGNSLYCPTHSAGSFSPHQLHQFAESHFMPGNTSIVGVGIDHEQLLHILQHKLGLGKEGASDKLTAPKAQYFGGEVRIPTNSKLVHVAVVSEGVSLGSKDMLPLAVLQKALGTGPHVKYSLNGNSRATQAAAKATSAPFAVSAVNVNYSDSGLFGFYVVTQAKDAGSVLKSVISSFSSATKVALSEQDLLRAKNQLKCAVLMDLESGESITQDMASQVALTGQVLDVQSIITAIDSISPADIQSVAKKVINGKPSMAAVGGLGDLPYLDQLV